LPDARTSVIVLTNLAVPSVNAYIWAVADIVLPDRLAPEVAGPGRLRADRRRPGGQRRHVPQRRRTVWARLGIEDDAPVLDLSGATRSLQPVGPSARRPVGPSAPSALRCWVLRASR
jgi:hypothetical protein